MRLRAPVPEDAPSVLAVLEARRRADLARRWEQESSGYIDLLAVHPERRRRGLGSAMLGTTCAACAAAGLHEAI